MTSISEERKKVLRSKLKEMGNYGVQERSPEESPFYDQPTELERDLENSNRMNRKKRKKKNLLQGLLQQNRQQNLYGLKK